MDRPLHLSAWQPHGAGLHCLLSSLLIASVAGLSGEDIRNAIASKTDKTPREGSLSESHHG